MRTSGMCLLLVCLGAVSSGQSTNASQSEDVGILSEDNRTAAGRTAASLHPDDGSPLSLGEISFLPLMSFHF